MRFVPCLLLLSALAGCGGDKKPAPPAPATIAPAKPATAAPAAPTPAATGSIEGVIVLAEGGQLPSLPDPKKSSKLAVVEPPAPCTPIGDADLHPVKRDAAAGGLSSVHVALTGMTGIQPATPVTHELRLDDCRLDQSLMAVRQGDSIRITNLSKPPLLPGIVGDSFMQAILTGTSRTLTFDRPGAQRIACAFGSYCGQTDVLITTHPLFAVSDKQGHFRIDNVPLDQEITVHAWHPLFAESHEAVKLSSSERSRNVRLVLTPNPPAVEPKPVKLKPGQPVIH